MPAPNPARHGGAKKKDAMKADGVLERQSERPLGRYQCGTGAAAPDAHAHSKTMRNGGSTLCAHGHSFEWGKVAPVRPGETEWAGLV